MTINKTYIPCESQPLYASREQILAHLAKQGLPLVGQYIVKRDDPSQIRVLKNGTDGRDPSFNPATQKIFLNTKSKKQKKDDKQVTKDKQKAQKKGYVPKIQNLQVQKSNQKPSSQHQQKKSQSQPKRKKRLTDEEFKAQVIANRQKPARNGNRYDFLYTLQNRLLRMSLVKKETQRRDYLLRQAYAELLKDKTILYISRQCLTHSLLKIGFRFVSNVTQYLKVLKSYLEFTVDHALDFEIIDDKQVVLDIADKRCIIAEKIG